MFEVWYLVALGAAGWISYIFIVIYSVKLKRKLDDARSELMMLNSVFDKSLDADRRAIKLWQDEDPAKRAYIWPDRCDMVVWLLKRDRNELQKIIDQHANFGKMPYHERIEYLTLALCGEAGELANVIKKWWRKDDEKPLSEWMPKIRDELADVGNYLYMLAAVLRVDLPVVMYDKLKAVEERMKADKWHGGA